MSKPKDYKYKALHGSVPKGLKHPGYFQGGPRPKRSDEPLQDEPVPEPAPQDQRWRVFCDATKELPDRSQCGFRGGRRAATKEQAEAKPCPRCGGGVTAFPK